MPGIVVWPKANNQTSLVQQDYMYNKLERIKMKNNKLIKYEKQQDITLFVRND